MTAILVLIVKKVKVFPTLFKLYTSAVNLAKFKINVFSKCAKRTTHW